MNCKSIDYSDFKRTTMDRQDRCSVQNLEELLQSGEADDDDDGFAHDSNDDVFGGAFNADDLLNCSLSSGGGLDLSTSMNRTAGGHMSFSNSQGNLSTDEGEFGVFNCDLATSRIPGLGSAGIGNLQQDSEDEYSSSQFTEPHDGRHSYLSSRSSHDNTNLQRGPSPTQAVRQHSPDMTLEMVMRTNSLTLGSFHGTTNHSMSQSQQHLADGSQRPLQQQQQYEGNQIHRSHNSHPTTNNNSFDQSPGPRRLAPIHAFSSDFSDDGRSTNDVLKQEETNNFQQQQLPQQSMLGDGCILTNNSNHLPFNGMSHRGNGGHLPSPAQSCSTHEQYFPGINLECAPLSRGNVNGMNSGLMNGASGSNNNNCMDGSSVMNGMSGTNGMNVNFMNGISVSFTDPKEMNLEEMQQELQQLQKMQQLQQHQGNMDNHNHNNFQVQGINMNNFQMMPNSMSMPNNNFQIPNTMSFSQPNIGSNNFQIPNNFSQMPIMQQMLNGSTFQNSNNTNSCGDTLLGNFPQGNAFAGMQSNVSIACPTSAPHCTPNKPLFPIVTTNSTSFADAPLSPVAASLKAAPAPSSMNEVMEKLSERMRRSAMSRSVVKQMSGRNIIARPNPVMIMAQKQRGMVQRATSDRSPVMGDASSGRPIPVRRMSNSAKHHIHQHLPNRSLHRHNSQQSLDGNSSHNTTSFQMDGRNMGTL